MYKLKNERIYILLINIYLITTILTTGFVYGDQIPKMPFTIIRYLITAFCFLKVCFYAITVTCNCISIF